MTGCLRNLMRAQGEVRRGKKPQLLGEHALQKKTDSNRQQGWRSQLSASGKARALQRSWTGGYLDTVQDVSDLQPGHTYPSGSRGSCVGYWSQWL